jgi:hypothetical protein
MLNDRWENDFKKIERASAIIDEIIEEKLPEKDQPTLFSPEIIREKLTSVLDWQSLNIEARKLLNQLCIQKKIWKEVKVDNLPLKFKLYIEKL